MRTFLKITLTLLLTLPIFSLGSLHVQAVGAGYGVTPLLPKNQLDDASYFNLLVSPQSSQKLTLQLTNQEDDEKTIRITPTTARTNQQGNIEYASNKADLNKGPAISELLSPPQTITLAAKETQVVSFTLTLPATSFEGILLGSFLIQEVLSETTSAAINNQFAYQIGLMVRESTVLPEPKMTFDHLQLTDEALFVTLTNQNGRLLSGTLKGILTNTEQSFTQGIQLAPNSTAKIRLPFGVLSSGAAYLKLTFSPSEDNQFSYEQSLYLHQGNKALEMIQLPFSWQLLLGIALVLGLIVLSLVFWLMKHKLTKNK